MNLQTAVRRLSQLGALKREIEDLSQRIAEMEVKAQGGVARITGMPFSGRIADPTAEYGAEIARLHDLLSAARARCLSELAALYQLIDGIPDSLTRQIFTLRYVRGRSWLKVAFAIGEYDEQVPRRLHNRYISRLPEDAFGEETCQTGGDGA